ncbi:MAG: ribbon-helix-helix domain-containing protein [Candidatus Berkelbacteria bacterium]|nr:ribbon-helix-helix domain-containing protein [Candidatus Berkelbacteria bacterium]MCR4307746.1 ribbon-helix-helix domain-containing protein [Candidatus Berkelbacteria bacterium]
MKTKTINLSLPGELLQDADRVAKLQYRSRSDLMREALRRFISIVRFEELNAYGARQAKKLGLKPTDVDRLISEVRTEG